MPRAAARFRQADVTRALRAVEKAKARAEIKIEPDGTIRIIPVDDKPDQPSQAPKRKDFVL